MIHYLNDKQIEQTINNNEELILVFAKGIDCSVCHAVENRINTDFTKKHPNLKIYYVTMEESPLFRGKHLIFTVPTLMLFDGNKELLRESRFIDFNKIERLINLYDS